MQHQKCGLMKALAMAFIALVCGSLSAAVIDTYDGLVEAIGLAEEGATIKLKAGSIVVTAPLTVAKGIVLSGGWTDDATRADGATTTLDGADSTSVESVVEFSNASGTAQLDRIVVTRGYRHGLMKTGNGDLVLSDSSFLANGLTSAGSSSNGRGLNLTGSGATVYVRNCVFAGNGQSNADNSDTSGGAVYAKSLKRFVVDGSLFVTNGHNYASFPAGANIWGYAGTAIYANNAPVTIRSTKFLGNSGNTWRVAGSAVYLCGASGGSAFTNCVFAGNQTLSVSGPYVTESNYASALSVNLSQQDAVVDVSSCTIAYNIGSSVLGSAGIGVLKGTVRIRNSIVYGNVRSGAGTGLPGGADLSLSADGRADVAFSWLTEDSADCSSGLGVTMGPGVRYGDPGLRTTFAQAQALMTTGAAKTYKPDQATLAALATMDVREAVGSPAVDAGDPGTAYDGEPAGHNGSRINLGAFGNTAEAAPSDPVVPEVESVDITFPGNATRPFVTVKMSESAGDYDAIVSVQSGVGGYDYESIVYGVRPGASFTTSPGEFFTAGDTYQVLVTVRVAGFDDVTADASVVVTGERPIWIGHGGGANVVHVRAGATGAATGRDWSDAYPDLMSGLQAIRREEKGELWIAGEISVSKTPDTLVPIKSLVVRGGFTGAEDSPEERVVGAKATLDGCDSVTQLLDFNNAAGIKVTIEDLTVKRGYWRAIKKAGAGDLVVRNCLFADNGRAANPSSNGMAAGCGLLVTGGSGTMVSVVDCVFEGNCLTNGASNACQGGAIYASTLKELVLERSRFEENGLYLPTLGNVCKWGVTGAAVCATDAPVTARNCQFVANHAISWNVHGGTVYLGGAAGGSSFANCVFAGNESVIHDGGIAGGRSSALVLNLSSATAVVGVKNCTFAYNLSWSKIPAAGIGVVKGALTVRNSIFYGNRYTVDETASGVDISVSADGSADVTYSLLSANDRSSYTGFTPGVGVIYGDPKFVTDKATVDALVSGKGIDRTYAKTLETQAALAAIDVHLQSKKGYFTNDGTKVTDGTVDSPALDAGNPDDDFSNETEPNGSCVNLGAYGNTSEASNSESTAPAIESVEVTYPGEYTQPTVVVKVGAEGGGEGAFQASVKVEVTDAAGQTVAQTFTGVECGQSVANAVKHYYQPGELITVRVTVSVPGFEDVVNESPMTVDSGKVLPPWYDKGGPANVVHLWADAHGAADGTSWSDAFTDIKSALAELAADGKDELWIVGEVRAMDEQGVLVPVRPLTVRGGFTAVENTAAERPADTTSTITGADVVEYVLQVNNAVDVPVTFERIRFVDGKYRGLKTSGAGDVTFVGCAIEGNGKGQTVDDRTCDGLGARFTGVGSTVTFSNCVVAGNVQASNDRSQRWGAGVYADAIKKLVLDDVAFVTNGVPHSLAQGAVAAWGGVGTALYAYNTPVEARGCRFIGNNGVTHRTYGSSVFLNGTCGGSAFVNCAFVGNQTTKFGTPYDSMSDYAAAFSMNLSSVDATVEFKNCTIAYNIAASYMGSAGIGVVKGTVRVRDSIVFGNVHSDDGKAGGADISISANGRADVAYTLLTANDGSSWTGEGVTLGEGMVYGNPLLVTTPEDAVGCMTATAPRYYKTDAAEALSKFNVHLRGRHGYVDEKTGELVKFVGAKSPALDAGDPASAFANEPSPNGRRVNLGYYGNTPWATLSPGGLVIILK